MLKSLFARARIYRAAGNSSACELADMKDQQLLKSQVWTISFRASFTAVGCRGDKSGGLPPIPMWKAVFSRLQQYPHHDYDILSCRSSKWRSSSVLLMQFCHGCMLD